MPFVIVPASQVQQKAKKATGQGRGRPKGTSPNQTAALKKNSTMGKRAVTVAAYGGKLFEPIIAREKPIYVHFLDFIVRDDDAITRFSEDGFFAIKFFLTKTEGKSRCYLAYFKNAISPTSNHNLMQACKEAIDYELYEFLDTDEYVTATTTKDIVGRLSDYPEYNLAKLRLMSALGQAEQKIISILQEKIIAEKFLLRQKEYEKQDKSWQKELERLNHAEEELLEREEEEDGFENSDDEGSESTGSTEEIGSGEEIEEDEEVLEQIQQEATREGVSSEESVERFEVKKPVSSVVAIQWGGGRKK